MGSGNSIGPHSPDARGEGRDAAQDVVQTHSLADPLTVREMGDDHITVAADTADAMRAAGRALAAVARGGDVITLSGPLGAGKTTFAQGVGEGLCVTQPVVSPTFTIARSLTGRFPDGTPARLVHVDAYRLPGSDENPTAAAGRLMDELEALGLDEELEDPGPGTVILIEWGCGMARRLAPRRLDVAIERPTPAGEEDALTGEGRRLVTFTSMGAGRLDALADALEGACKAAADGAAEGGR